MRGRVQLHYGRTSLCAIASTRRMFSGWVVCRVGFRRVAPVARFGFGMLRTEGAGGSVQMG